MWLGIFIASVALLGYQSEAAVIDDLGTRSFSVRAAASIKTLCLKNADQATSEEALAKLNEIVEKCWSIKTILAAETDEERTRLCVEHQQNMFHCIDRFLEKFKPCLGSEEDYVSQLIVDGYGNYSNYLCEHILEFIPDGMDSDVMTCISKFIKNPKNNPPQVCFENSTVFGSTSADTSFTKEKLCSDFRTARTCYGEKFGEHCPTATKLTEQVLGLLQNALSPCEDVLKNDGEEISENKL